MSRTIKGSKGAGYEYWGRRPTGFWLKPGRETKTITHRIERSRAKAELRRESR